MSDSTVKRDPLYTGNVIDEKCAVVMRLSPSFLRFGTFELFKESDPYSGREGPCIAQASTMKPQMLDFIISNFYPSLNKDFAKKE